MAAKGVLIENDSALYWEDATSRCIHTHNVAECSERQRKAASTVKLKTKRRQEEDKPERELWCGVGLGRTAATP